MPPHNEDAERSVLGSPLLAPDRIPDLLAVLNHEDFFVGRKRQDL
ncbi:MAG: DnaB-like helicase N-terminal domain-containing protein [Planctomycetota bacterium]